MCLKDGSKKPVPKKVEVEPENQPYHHRYVVRMDREEPLKVETLFCCVLIEGMRLNPKTGLRKLRQMQQEASGRKVRSGNQEMRAMHCVVSNDQVL
jgi:hypothetical protein